GVADQRHGAGAMHVALGQHRPPPKLLFCRQRSRLLPAQSSLAGRAWGGALPPRWRSARIAARRHSHGQRSGFAMIDLYSWPTPNGHKIHIMLEETGLAYRVHGVNIGKGDQFAPEFLAISPNNKIPALVDPHGPDGKPISMFESGAMLIYLAEKCGRLLPDTPRERYATLEWLMFQMGGIGPMLGQAHHFRLYAPEKIGYAIDRYTKEAGRLYGVVDRRLADRDYLAGE